MNIMEKRIKKMSLLADHIEDLVLNYSKYPHRYEHRPNSSGDVVYFMNGTYYMRLYSYEVSNDQPSSIIKEDGSLYFYPNSTLCTCVESNSTYDIVQISDDIESSFFQQTLLYDFKETEVIILFSLLKHKNLPSFFMEKEVYYYYNEITGK